MSIISENAKAIFLEAVEKHAPEEWPQFLDQVCGDDRKLRGRVEGLLQAHVEKDSLFDRVEPTVDMETPTQHVGEQIGPYKLLQELGEGGMGLVYLAERQKPVKQRVALKIIKQGMDTRKFVARFEAERQALAMMDHPNIAKVLDAGCTDNGRPYFVMELVKGVPINQFCDDNRLTTRERLELFTQVCQAVHHAHQKGIIHRDLKPSNVLVALYDDKPVPKVIDFGVAKATNQQLTEKTLFTEVGSILGTWEYMSPEQAVLNQLDVDTRSDVYSLGVLLYELLTGETPLDRQRLREAQIMETLRMIREDEPPKPSTRVSSLGKKAPMMAAYRRANPDSLASEIRGDLDWIVMKALAKERSRRYDSASRFVEDLQRHLNNDVVEARPPSTAYRLSRFYRRNRVVVTFATAFIVLLVVASTGMTLAFLDADKKRREADEARQETQLANSQLRESVLKNTLADVLTGDTDRGVVAIERASSANVPAQWIALLKAMNDCNGARFDTAKEELRKLLSGKQELDGPSELAIRAALAVAFMQTGDDDGFLTQIEIIDDQSKTHRIEHEAERLLVAYAWALFVPDKALDLLAENRDRPIQYPIELMFRATARAYDAMGRRDFERLDQAIADHEYAGEFSGPTEAHVQQAALVYRLALELAQQIQPHRVPEFQNKLVELKEELSNRGSLMSKLALIQTLDLFGDEYGRLVDTALSIKFGSSVIVEYPAAYIFGRESDPDRCVEIFNNLQVDDSNPHFLVPLAIAEADREGSSDALLRTWDRIRSNPESLPESLYRGLVLLGLAGERDQLRIEANKLLNSLDSRIDHWGMKDALEFWADDTGAVRRELESVGMECVDKFAVIQHALGIEALSRGDREQALIHFDNIQQSGMFVFHAYGWTRAYRDRIRQTQKAWPTWIPVSTDSL